MSNIYPTCQKIVFVISKSHTADSLLPLPRSFLSNIWVGSADIPPLSSVLAALFLKTSLFFLPKILSRSNFFCSRKAFKSVSFSQQILINSFGGAGWSTFGIILSLLGCCWSQIGAFLSLSGGGFSSLFDFGGSFSL